MPDPGFGVDGQGGGLVKKKNRLFVGLGSGVLLVVLVVLVVLVMLENDTRSRPTVFFPYSVDSPAPHGMKAFVTLLDKYYDVEVYRGESYEMSMKPMPEGSGTLMIMADSWVGWSESETERWIEWMKRGNSLWLVASSPWEICPSLLEMMPDTLAKAPSSQASLSGPLWGGGRLDGTYQARTRNLAPERLLAEPDDERLLWDEQGIVCLARSFENGELVALSAPEWLLNAYILDYDHVKILTFLLTRDEPHRICIYEDALSAAMKQAMLGQQNLGSRGSDQKTSQDKPQKMNTPKGILFLSALLILLVLLELWRRGLRFGLAEIPRAESVRFGDERIRALGSWYQRRSFYGEALTVQANYVKDLLREKWGVSSWQDVERLRGILQARMDTRSVEVWLNDFWLVCSEGWPAKMRSREYASWSRRLSKMQEEAES